MQHGLDESLVARVRSNAPDLDDTQRTALDLADAMMADPAGIGTQLRDRLHRHFTSEQITELALDVMKWSYQKYAVALGMDRPVVEGELTDLVFDEDGNWVRPG